MRKISFGLLGLTLFALAYFLPNSVHAQLYEFGINGGYNVNRLVPETNTLNNSYFIRQGRVGGGYSIGMYYQVGPPKAQPKPGLNLKSIILYEGSFCRCGANLSATKTLINGKKSFQNINYLMYRGDYSAKYMLGIGRLRFMVGPQLTYLFYSGFRVDQLHGLRTARSHFNRLSYGYEAGIGIQVGPFRASGRMGQALSKFGKSFQGASVNMKNTQYKIMIAYRLKQKHKGSYWESIKWD